MDCSSSSWKPSYSTVVFDLIDVLFTWSPPTQESLLPPKVLHSILPSIHWFQYEKGILSEDKVYASISAEFGVEVTDVKSTLQAARETLQKNNKMLVIDRQLKEFRMEIYALSNISAADWAVLSTRANSEDWPLFRCVFTSATLGEWKPNIGVYKRVIKQSWANPAQTIFVDDKLENVITARSLGMRSIIPDNESQVIRQLENLCYDPITRGQEYLLTHKKKLRSFILNNIQFLEVC